MNTAEERPQQDSRASSCTTSPVLILLYFLSFFLSLSVGFRIQPFPEQDGVHTRSLKPVHALLRLGLAGGEMATGWFVAPAHHPGVSSASTSWADFHPV